MKCSHCGCEAHCGHSCTDCWECPDCHCADCTTKEDPHLNLTNADARD
jgi:hypothetical protein